MKYDIGLPTGEYLIDMGHGTWQRFTFFVHAEISPLGYYVTRKL